MATQRKSRRADGPGRKRSTGRSPQKGAERLQKLLAAAGVASRRASEDLIRAGRVRVNGHVIRELGTRADPAHDKVQVDGRRIRFGGRRRHYVLHKPRGIVSTTSDPHADRTVLDLVPTHDRLFPVGRLDAASEGLLLLTNDGELAQRLLHPSFRVPRTYRVSVDGRVRAATLRKIQNGVELDGGTTAPCEVTLREQGDERSVLEVTLIEGRKRQIRDMMRALGHPVRRLLRVRFGPLRLGRLKAGDWRPLTTAETAALTRMRAEATPPAGNSEGKGSKRIT